jgi:glucosylceramidase
MIHPSCFVSTLDRKYECSPIEISDWIPIQSSAYPIKSKNTEIYLDFSKKLHSILGMGYSFEHTSCANLLLLKEQDRIHALELMVHPECGAGMNLWRLCIGTSDFTGTPWYSYCGVPPAANITNYVKYVDQTFSLASDRELILPIVKQALEINPNILFFASPWSPPGWMKDSGRMCGGRLLPQFYTAYACYLVKFVQAYEQEGIPIHAITVQNEPYHNTKSMPSCYWSPTQERDFIRDYLGPAINNAKLKTQIWCYDHNWDDIPFHPTHYPQVIMQDINAAKFVQGIAFHHYSMLNRIHSNPKLMQLLRKNIPNTPFYFTEGSLFGLQGSLRLSRYIKYGSSSYNGWVPMIATDGTPNNGPFHAKRTFIQRNIADNSLLLHFEYFLYKQYAKFIHRGAQVVEIYHNKIRGFESLALQNSNGSKVCIFTNSLKKIRKILLKVNSPSNQILAFELKPQSISTIYWI